ncbi:PD-(D/E)XK motif protein [Methylomonas fluvii]|uniref:PD-(D/E)XK motif protein n=1 Tax=Methylomonas fluvii TaxID=1854564 RepID=A0ABR9DKX3_9GAMM|nr:PD-(D/E)XK motif protein [Methylomonas fluvii]MBD9363766.1 PD-(D/E)XK motif protein [Methylomonas fluvii]
MALQNKTEELLAAWRALTGNPDSEGWLTIPVTHDAPCQLIAGRHFPGNEEALLAGFSTINVSPAEKLPQGHGFLVTKTTLGAEVSGLIWIALCRQSTGSLDLFTRMTNDVVMTLEGIRGASDQKAYQTFIGRIRAWQDFMSRNDNGILCREAELGLFGELELLKSLIATGMPAPLAVDAWCGPMGGVQDFAIGTGAIEVKSTVSSNSFPANIGSLDQLDDSLIQPLFLAGFRFVLSQSGITLPEQIGIVRNQLSEFPFAKNDFDSRLLHAGYIDDHADYYSRRFLQTERKIFHISEIFPRLTRANVANEIRGARYDLDLDMITTTNSGLENALTLLGVIL